MALSEHDLLVGGLLAGELMFVIVGSVFHLDSQMINLFALADVGNFLQGFHWGWGVNVTGEGESTNTDLPEMEIVNFDSVCLFFNFFNQVEDINFLWGTFHQDTNAIRSDW